MWTRLIYLYLYSYEAKLIRVFLWNNKMKLVWSFIYFFRYNDDVLSLNNSSFNEYLDQLYPSKLEIKATNFANKDIFLDIDKSCFKDIWQTEWFQLSYCKIDIYIYVTEFMLPLLTGFISHGLFDTLVPVSGIRIF